MYQPTNFADTIFRQRYALNHEESWEDACERVAKHISSAENGNRDKWSSRFKDVMVSNRFVPGGRIWYGSGRLKGQLLNCFVVPADDSREGWGKTVSDMLVISGTGGGVGINFSPIRPRGTPIRGTGGQATGAVSLMEVINQTGEVIKAGGGRRTALMQCLRYDHADIMEFLSKKFNRFELTEENTKQLIMETYPNLPSDSLDEILDNYDEGVENVIRTLV